MALSPDDFQNLQTIVAVPRETGDRLENFIALLKKWQNSINLVSKNSLDEVWKRHIIDSAQLYPYLAKYDAIIDFGSGAGFPGLILAILGMAHVTLVESDTRKTSFLKEAARITDAKITIKHQRVEDIDLSDFSTITARGFASISSIFSSTETTRTPSHKFLLLKGKNYQNEISDAKLHWDFDYIATPSRTDPEGVVLSIHHVNARRLS